MQEITLTKGKVAIVDDEDLERVNSRPWVAQLEQGIWYATRKMRGQKQERMHRVIANAPEGSVVDHLNGNGLDNQKINLRVVGHSENVQNCHRLPRNTSGYRGVTWHKQCHKWQAAIKRHGKAYHLGLYYTKEDAARAYDKAAFQIYGPQSNVNFKREVM